MNRKALIGTLVCVLGAAAAGVAALLHHRKARW